MQLTGGPFEALTGRHSSPFQQQEKDYKRVRMGSRRALKDLKVAGSNISMEEPQVRLIRFICFDIHEHLYNICHKCDTCIYET